MRRKLSGWALTFLKELAFWFVTLFCFVTFATVLELVGVPVWLIITLVAILSFPVIIFLHPKFCMLRNKKEKQ